MAERPKASRSKREECKSSVGSNPTLAAIKGNTVIYVKIELWPFGDRDQRRTLGEMVIANDGSGSQTKGNYKVWHKTDPEKLLDNVKDPGESLLLRAWLGKMKPDRVENYPRKAVTIWHLIRKAIESAGFTQDKLS